MSATSSLDGGDIFGDGVNVAARLEALCEPGGVCISRSANEQVRDKLSLAFADLGEQTVKNIARAVGVFGLAAKDIAALPEEALPEPEAARIAHSAGTRAPPPSRSDGRRRGRRGGAPCRRGLVDAARQDVPLPATRRGSASGTPRPVAYSPQDRRQSVIVLPFENSSGDPAQDGIAAGITRDVTDLIAGEPAVPPFPRRPRRHTVGSARPARDRARATTCISRSRAMRAGRTGA